LLEVFGVRSFAQLRADLGHVIGRLGRSGFQLDLSSVKHLRPDLSLPAYAGRAPTDALAPVMNLFDRVAGGRGYSQRVTKHRARDFRGGALSYDEHDGTDLVCPVGTPVVAAAPGVVTLVRDRWLRGGLTMTVDHGAGLTTQYTHLSRTLAPVGERVARGQVIASSGVSGLDMTAFFPWVAPHLHFMVWHRCAPVDPFVTDSEPERTGTWTRRNAPAPPEQAERSFPEPEVDVAFAREVASRCRDPAIGRELERVRHAPLSLVALLEDSLHHDRFAWPALGDTRALRRDRGELVRLSLPLCARRYRGARFADGWGSAPATR
jgi:hypothetical protein